MIEAKSTNQPGRGRARAAEEISSGSRRRPPGATRATRQTRASIALLFLGMAAAGAWFLITPALAHGRYYKVGFNRTTYEYTRPLLLLFLPYATALLAWRKGGRVPLWVLLGGAVVLHILVLFAPLPQSQDFYQYLFYGRVQAAHGANPYLVDPSAFWADRWFPWIRWSGQPSVYGPVWMLITWAAAKVSLGNLAAGFVFLKLVILSLDVSIMAMLAAGGKGQADDPAGRGWGVLAYAWNPLVLITVPLGGAADVALAAAIVGAILARRRGRTGLCTVLLALGGLVKVYGLIALLLHLTLLARERGGRRALAHAAAAGAVAVAAYAKYWAGLATFEGLFKAAGLTNESLAGTVQRLLIPVLHGAGLHQPHLAFLVVRFAGGALLVSAIGYALILVRNERTLWTMTMFVLTAYLFLTPWFLYWYTVAPLAMAAMLPRNRLTDPILIFSGTSLVSVGGALPLRDWVAQSVLRYIPPVAFRRRRRPALEVVHGGGGAPIGIAVPRTAASIQRAPAAK